MMRLALLARSDFNDAAIGPLPKVKGLRRERGMKDRLKLVVFLLGNWFKFVVVATGALDPYAQKRVHRHLQDALEYIVPIKPKFVRIAVAVRGSVGRIAQKMRGD